MFLNIIIYLSHSWVTTDENNQTKFSKPLKIIEFVLFRFQTGLTVHTKDFYRPRSISIDKSTNKENLREKKKSMRKSPLNFYWNSDKEWYEEILTIYLISGSLNWDVK